MGSKLIKTNETYRDWIREVSSRFRRSQIKAAVKVNDEMLRFYWTLGRDMEAQKEAYAWGSHFYKTISEDLRTELPDVKSFSPRNLLYMHQFYRLFPEAGIAPRPGAQLDNGAEPANIVRGWYPTKGNGYTLALDNVIQPSIGMLNLLLIFQKTMLVLGI